MEKFDSFIPPAVKDFIFDLYSSTMMSMRLDEIAPIYEVRYKDITENYFSQTVWPECRLVSAECYHDEVFLIFYK
jgi:hypothetical protein